MSFDSASYEFESLDARLQAGAVLFRIVSPVWCDEAHIVNGNGASLNTEEGRFHLPQQRASYCANNALVCIAECLFHMYRQVLSRIANADPAAIIREASRRERRLAVFQVKTIEGLVNIGDDGVSGLDGRIRGTTVVFPDAKYEPFKKLQVKLRHRQSRGIVYPSARHSMDSCIMFFGDESASVMRGSLKGADIELFLVDEDCDRSAIAGACDPWNGRVHATLGGYRFIRPSEHRDLVRSGSLNPVNLPLEGLVDFVRRRYVSYPGDAVLP